MPVYRSDQAAVHVTVTGVALDNIVWDTFAGGDNTASSTNYPPGGMQPSIELGGVPTRSPITVTRAWSDALIGVYKALDQASGRTPGAISITTLDATGRPVGVTTTYTGVLLTVTRPGYDHATSAAGMLQLVFGMNESIS